MVLADPSELGGKLRTFDYDAALKMTQVSTESSPSTQEQQTSPEKGPVFFRRPTVFRPGDNKRRSRADRIKAALAVGAFGLAGVATGAAAGGINTKQYEEEAKMAIGNAVLGAIISDAAIKRDAFGNKVLVRKSPQEMALNIPLDASPQVKAYAKAIGVGILSSGNILTVLNEGNPGQCVTIPRYTSDTQYVTGLKLTAAEGGGLLLHVNYVQGLAGNRLIPKSQIVTIRTDANHNMACTIIGG